MQKDAFFSLKSKRCDKSESYNFSKIPIKESGCTDHECKAMEYTTANADWNLKDENDNISEESSDNDSITSVVQKKSKKHG